MTEQQIAAMRQALEYIRANADSPDEWDMVKDLTAALEQPKQKCNYPYCGCDSKAWCKVERNAALDKMAENARELGLDYEPAQRPVKTFHDGKPWYVSEPAQQEPVVRWICKGCGHEYMEAPSSCDCMESKEYERIEYYTHPAPEPVIDKSAAAAELQRLHEVTESLWQVAHHRNDRITTLEAAMRQALEALKFGLHVGFDESSESQIKKGGKAFDQHSKAITALTAALEQPAQQEPVSVMTVLHLKDRTEIGYGPKSAGYDLPTGEYPLYTRPQAPEPVIDKSAAIRIATALGWEPKREPLTDEQIDGWHYPMGTPQELRRLHALNQELLEALRQIVDENGARRSK